MQLSGDRGQRLVYAKALRRAARRYYSKRRRRRVTTVRPLPIVQLRRHINCIYCLPVRRCAVALVDIENGRSIRFRELRSGRSCFPHRVKVCFRSRKRRERPASRKCRLLRDITPSNPTTAWSGSSSMPASSSNGWPAMGGWKAHTQSTGKNCVTHLFTRNSQISSNLTKRQSECSWIESIACKCSCAKSPIILSATAARMPTMGRRAFLSRNIRSRHLAA